MPSFIKILLKIHLSTYLFNSLPNDKILDWSKLKAFADDKINVTVKLKFSLGRVENIVGNGENAAYQLRGYVVFQGNTIKKYFFCNLMILNY